MKLKKYALASLAIGSSAGILHVLLFLALFGVGLSPMTREEFLFLPLYFVVHVAGLHYYRTKFNRAELRTLEAFIIATGTNLIACLSMLLFIYTFLEFLNPDYFQEYLHILKNMITDTNNPVYNELSPEQLAEKVEQVQQITPMMIAKDKFFKYSVFGFFLALIAGFLSRQRSRQS